MCCPNLGFVELAFNSIDHLESLCDALSSYRSLETVRFTNPEDHRQDILTPDLVLTALRRKKLRNIRNIEIRYVESQTPSLAPDQPRVTIPRASIAFWCSHFSERFLPQDPSALKEFSLDWCYVDSGSLDWLLNHLPATISVVSLRDRTVPYSLLSSYLQLSSESVPVARFSRFTSLSRLALQGYQGPSLDLLETLASSSPSLARLDFQHSKWTPCRSSQGSPFVSNDSIHGLVDPDDLLERLLEFNELIWVHLGYLPTKVEETYAILRQELQQKRGIRVDWDCCRF